MGIFIALVIKLTLDNVQIGNTIILAFGSEIHMKLDIPYYIRQVLREQRMVYVPGIGTFSLVQSSAIFNDDKTNIAPPSLSLSFNDEESDDESLLRYILDTGLLSEEKAKKKLDQFTQSAFNKLLNVDAFLIDGVGTIAKRTGNDKVEFEPRLSELTREFNDLIPLSLTPISRINEQVPIIGLANNSPQIEESGSFLPRIFIITLLLLAAYFIGDYLKDHYFNQPEDTELSENELDSTDNEISLAESNEKELEQKYEEIDELIDPSLKDKEKEASSLTTEEDKNGGENLPESIGKEIDNNAATENNEAVAKSINTDDDSKVTVKNENSESIDESTNNSNPQNKYASIIPESGECIIVVGSFMKTLNAIKMTSLLERKGYKVYQSQYKGYTRIGLKYECMDEDLEAYLQTIRKSVSKKAWYLDPQLDVPYPK